METKAKWVQAFNPTKDEWVNDRYFISSAEEIDAAVEQAVIAFGEFKEKTGEERAIFLDTIAEEIMNLGDILIEKCAEETGLSTTRLSGERSRTVNQLKLFAQVLRDGSWVNARIDRKVDESGNTVSPDIRQMQIPIGPVAVFEASNFPLAFSTAGGDTASALAAGCPVVVKSHSNHPGTSSLVAQAVKRAIRNTSMPEGTFSLVHGPGQEVGVKLVNHPGIKAVGFTGSFQGGMSLYKEAVNRPDPIPVYAEMGSINPVFILPTAARKLPKDIAEKLVNSIVLGAGQFCTNPGLIMMPETDDTSRFREYAHQLMASVQAAPMLSPKIKSSFDTGVESIMNTSGFMKVSQGISKKGSCYGTPHLLETTADVFLKNERRLTEEVFGPASLMVTASDSDELMILANRLSGHLTVTVFAEEDDFRLFGHLLSVIGNKAGRIIYNGVPTGVEVCHAMVHGGPFPATSDVRTTSVGTQAIYRFTRPVCYQDFPQEMLPSALLNDNPQGIFRLVNGEITNMKIQ